MITILCSSNYLIGFFFSARLNVLQRRSTMSASNYHIPSLIAKKRDGKSFTADEINFLINAIANKRIDDAQIGMNIYELSMMPRYV